MTNLHLLSKLKGLGWVELAEQVGYDAGNLRNGIIGNISLSEKPLQSVYRILGLNNKGFLRHDMVHVWHLITKGKRRYNLDAFRYIFIEAFPELFAEYCISQRFTCADKQVRQKITLVSASVYSGESDADHGRYAEYVDIVVVQDLDSYVEITPKIVPGMQWLGDLYQLDSIDPDREPFDQVVSRDFWERLVAGEVTQKDLLDLRKMPPTWSWDRVVFFASKVMSPSQAAEKLGIADEPSK